MATITLTVTVSNPGSGNKYYIDGALQATVSMIPGNTYKFDQADNSNSGHPLRLSTTSNGSHNSGSEYTTGVTTSGTPGSSGAYTQIEVTVLTVQSLYYYCTAHSGMGGSFNTGSSATVQYQDREGFNIQNFSADQTSVGQIYYNTSSGSFKAVKDGGAPIGTWSSSGAMNTARTGGLVAGSLTAGLYFGGYVPGSALGVTTISYDGSSWSAQNNMLISRYTSGSGTQTAALAPGGYQNTNSLVPAAGYTLACEQYDGTNWSNTCNNNITRGYQISSNRASNAPGTTGLVFGGSNNPSPGNTNTSEEFTGGTEVVTASTLTTS